MSDQYTIKDVTKDLGSLLALTKIIGPDDDNYWMDKATGERFLYQIDANDASREIAIFQDPMPKGDILFFNPFAEGFGKKAPAVQLYYRMVRVALNLNIRTAALYIIQSILEVKAAAKADKEHSLSHVLVRMSSVPIDRKTTLYDVVDDTMIGEFDKLFDRINDELVFIPYMQQQRTAEVRVDALTDDQWAEKYGTGVRKKTLGAFRSVIMGILGITKPEDLASFTVKHDPDIKTSVKLYTTLSVIMKLYTKFNDVLAAAYTVNGEPSHRDTVDLGELGDVIERLPLAYAIAKHMVQPVLPKLGATDTATADTSRLKIGENTTGRSRFAPPPTIDAMGREVRGGFAPTPAPSGLGDGRFKPHVLQQTVADPFSPVIRPQQTFGSAGSAFGPGGSPFGGGGSAPMFGGGGGSPFGTTNTNSYFGGGGGGGINLSPPSNFNAPGTNGRGYF